MRHFPPTVAGQPCLLIGYVQLETFAIVWNFGPNCNLSLVIVRGFLWTVTSHNFNLKQAHISNGLGPHESPILRVQQVRLAYDYWTWTTSHA
jgi:hypothetical protein